MKILVTDGDSRAALAITRSLGRAGHQIIVGSKRIRSLAGASTYCAAPICYPDPDRYGEAFMDFIADYVAHEKIDVLLPVTDITTLTIGANRSRIPEHCALPFPDIETVRAAADKEATMALAHRLGVDTPCSVTVESSTDIRSVEHGLSFPLVVKPFKSRVETANGWIYTAVTYAHDDAELSRILGELDPRAFPVMLQEKIVGPGIGIFICTRRGRILAAFSHRRLREKPPSGGVSVLRESVALDPLALDFAERLLRELAWTGVAMVEFKQDRRDGRPKLMEINGRFWGSLQLAIDAGVDFPRLLVDSLVNPNLEPVLTYRVGVRTRWLWGDIDALFIRLFRSGKGLDLAPGAPSRGRYLLEFLKSFGPITRLEVERVRDPGPAIYETLEWLRDVFRTLIPPA
ncbi:MAG: ATP-grasp domain-containing protein [Pseudomonadota bacterium]